MSLRTSQNVLAVAAAGARYAGEFSDAVLDINVRRLYLDRLKTAEAALTTDERTALYDLADIFAGGNR